AAAHGDETEGVPTLHADHGEDGGHSPSTAHATPHAWAVTPFVGLLLGIALFPLFELTALWWESNRNRFLTALVCAGLTLAYYFFIYGGWDSVRAAIDHAIIGEYIPFIVLLFSLYVISGGIRIGGDLTATPATNTVFLIAGALLASFVGTTGAAMLLVRPLIDTNDERKYVQHTIVFFIFVVCNCGGCLLPIGDPPLFLGYLLGVKFLWTLWNLWLPWLAVNALLVTIYYLLDRTYYYPKEALSDLRRDTRDTRPLKIQGLFPNAWLLLGVILSIALLDPSKLILGWRPWPFLREIVQLLLVAASLWYTPDRIRAANKFNYHAIQEVAALFIGIFICMQPAIEILHEKGGDFGLDTPTELFWVTGGLSAVLDNAPTYVVFFETAAADPRFQGTQFAELVSGSSELSGIACHLLMAISLGAVFLGSMTYIGNGPNFMVRAIAEEAGIKMPSFFGYVLRYSLPILVPVFFVVTYFFLPS
ncbi:MAG: sodium:proton antiporter, partial [Planctomycetota bacterium]